MTRRERPRHLWPEYAAQFQDVEVANAYRHRPPYPDEAVAIILDLLSGNKHHILEIGAGSGDFTTRLAPHVDRLIAVEPSEPMRKLGEARTSECHANVDWIASSAEAFVPTAAFDGVVAAESLHWMDWETVVPKLAECLTREGRLIMVDRAQSEVQPWQSELQSLLARFSTNRHFEAFDLLDELVSRNLIESVGRRQSAMTRFHQPIQAYIESFHSRNGFSRARLEPTAALTFDKAVEELVSPHANEGLLTLNLMTRVSWGRPLARVTRSAE